MHDLGRLDDAIAEYTRVTTEDPSNLQAQIALAKANHKLDPVVALRAE